MDVLCNPEYIKKTMPGFKFSKGKGQNFIIDSSVLERMALFAGNEWGVLEIGAGFGALTYALCQSAGHVLAIELDSDLIPVLKKNLSRCENLTLIEGNALNLDFKALAEEYMPDLKLKVIANLPYSITSPLIIKLVESGIEEIVVMTQREAAARINAPPGGKDYGSLSVFCGVFYETELLFGVPPESFMPRPEVFSSVIRLIKREKPLVPAEKLEMFFKVTRAAFNQRRKTLKNALRAAFPGLDTERVLVSAGFDPKIRGEVLDIAGFLKITEEMGV